MIHRTLTGEIEFVRGIETESAPSGDEGFGHGRDCVRRMEARLVHKLVQLINSPQRRRRRRDSSTGGVPKGKSTEIANLVSPALAGHGHFSVAGI